MKKEIALFEIILLISASFAFSALMHESDLPPVESTLVQKARALFISFFGANLVSAEENVLWTCPVNNEGTLCQEYGHEVCNDECSVDCFQGARKDFAACREGTCLDTQEGTCAPNTPQSLCQSSGGTWDARPLNEIPACRPGCCLVGSQALFRTERACDALRLRYSADVVFQPVSSELACLALSNRAEEGACIIGETEPGVYACRFIQKDSCAQQQGTFYGGLLCSHPSLNTSCERQATTSCVAGKDEVYWFDSCGNRENIYNSLQREQSWNNGQILAKDASCELGTSNNPLLRQSSCGNCNYLQGNRCGAPSAPDDEPSVGNFVCKDLSCTDSDGTQRKHGESWCAFDSRIGVQGAAGSNEQRSVDVPGSQHYRKTCANGVITAETCGTFRNQVCVESRIEQGDFSQAACRINQWQLCVAANSAADGVDDPTEASRLIKEACEEHGDCYVKSVDLRGGRGTFAFDLCLPRYPPAFDLQSASGGEEAQALCSLASVMCKHVKTKGLFGGGKEYNKLCKQAVGLETMNNVCISLGDCGAHINLEGDYSGQGFRAIFSRGTPAALSNGYIEGLRALENPSANQRVAPLNESEVSALLGSANLAQTDPLVEPSTASLQRITMITGASGVLLAYGIHSGFLASTVTTNPGFFSSLLGVKGSTAITAWGPFLNSAAGALIAAAGVAYIMEALGITAGLPPSVSYALIGLGAFGGGSIGYSLLPGAQTIFGFSALSVGLVALIAVVIIIAIFALFGLGSKKETKINFQCLPWQPPLGGAQCGQCGANGLPCTQYSCQSLGQTCRYIENSAGEQCVNSGIDDISAPFIRENSGVLFDDYRYEQVSERGYRLVGPEDNGCVPRFTTVALGISTNELSQCRIASTHTDSFESMDEYVHRFNDKQSNLFRRNHTMIFSLPSNEAIENERLIDEEFDDESEEVTQHYSDLFLPDSQGNVNLYIRCTDTNGNKNLEEYAINFCASPEPDQTAPRITHFDPVSPAYSALGAVTRPVAFYLNEPAECRWSEDSDRAYDQMTSHASCLTGLADGTLQGWYCNATLPAPSSERTFYFRCNDQPWLNESDNDPLTVRNANAEGVPYRVRMTQSPLVITSIDPSDETIFTHGLPATINFSVTTSGGAEGQLRFCSYISGTHTIRFLETGTDRHHQPGLRLYEEGAYHYPLACEDSAGNHVEGDLRFNLLVDDEGPVLTRVYNSNGLLTFITNEKARCAFNPLSCSFAFENGTAFIGEEFIHTSPFSSSVSHHVICRDLFGNSGSCTTIRSGIFS